MGQEQGKKPLNLDSLGRGLPGLTGAAGTYLGEAGAVCLDECGHADGKAIEVRGSYEADFALSWPQVTEQMRRTYNDQEETTELGACGLAILLAMELTGYTVVERAAKGGGFDYWLAHEDAMPFQNTARLEVSGIRRGDDTLIARRVKQKVDQTKKSDGLLPAYIAIIEFSRPAARMVKR